MATTQSSDLLMEVLRDTMVGAVRRAGPDLSARQFAVFLICYHEDGLHTVRGLSARLGVSKPAITRSLDRLVELELACRIGDPRDRRSVLVQRTRNGMELLADLQALLKTSADENTEIMPPPPTADQTAD